MKRDSKKILHVVNIFFVIPYFLGNQLRHFRDKGYEEHVICSPSKELKAYSQLQGFRYKEVPINRAISLWADLRALWATMCYIRRNGIGIVTGHTPKGGIVAMTAAWLCRVPRRIYFRHGLVYETQTGLKRRLLMTIDRIAAGFATDVVCVSESVRKRSLEDRLGAARKQKILHNGTCNGIDLRRFNPECVDALNVEKLRKELGIKPDDFVVGFVGRLVRDKGIIELVEAHKALLKEHPNLKLLLVGMFEQRDALPREIVTMINHDPSIIHTGYVDYGEIENYYSLMDVYVLPSYREGFPTSVLEAAAMRLPVITTRATGCVDSVVDGETGLFVGHSAEELASVISRLMQDGSLRESLGQRACDNVHENFDERVIWESIEKLYL